MTGHKLITANLGAAIAEKTKPGITLWNRLEGRPRAEKFDRALKAEIRDPLWMLTRQWQMGEFRGDDAGSPFFAKAHIETTRFRKYESAAGPVEPIDDARPLEPHVERLPLRFAQGVAPNDVDLALDLRLAMGRQWLKMIALLSAAAVPQFIAAYPVTAPDPLDKADASICAHPEVWSSFALAAGRLMDGYKLYRYLTTAPANSAADGIAALAGMEAQTAPIAQRFLRWFERWIYQPEGGGAWLSDRLEYKFAASAPHAGGEKVFVADQYYHGHLDWHSFDVDPEHNGLGVAAPEAPAPHTLTMLPVSVTFNGMPNTRWWKFEDGLTNFGDIRPDTTDLAKLMLIEFGLVYANDWFLIPFTLPAGSVANLRGLAVTNVFGERVWVEAAGRGADDDWQRWAMFLVSVHGKGDQPADLSLVVPPVAHQVIEGRPLEEALYARDEMANMVWGVERTIALPNGDAKLGREAAAETRAWFERDLERRLGAPPLPPPAAPTARIRYKVMSGVPENWIPMVPTHVEGDNRDIQLQRAAMPRVIDGDPDAPAPVEPRTALLRSGLDQTPKAPYFLHEEEVPRSGVRVSQAFQRTRTRTGEVLVWLGARKKTGRGESSSGLAFDRIETVK